MHSVAFDNFIIHQVSSSALGKASIKASTSKNKQKQTNKKHDILFQKGTRYDMIQLIQNSNIEVNLSRITKQQKEENYQKLNAVILNVFLTEGWSKVTYDRISKITGLRKSTLQGYYPSNNDFLIALQGNLKELMLKEIDFSSKEQLLSSWSQALSKKEFGFIVEMLISHCVSSEPSPIADEAMKSFHKIITTALPYEDSSELMVHIFGLAVIAPIRSELIEMNG